MSMTNETASSFVKWTRGELTDRATVVAGVRSADPSERFSACLRGEGNAMLFEIWNCADVSKAKRPAPAQRNPDL